MGSTKLIQENNQSSPKVLSGLTMYSVYILTDIHRKELVLGMSPEISKLKQCLELSSVLNPRYGAPPANRLVYIRNFQEPLEANFWLLELNHFTRIQKERMIISQNRNWENLWNQSDLVKIDLTVPKSFKSKYCSRRKLRKTFVEILPKLGNNQGNLGVKWKEGDKLNHTYFSDRVPYSTTTQRIHKKYPISKSSTRMETGKEISWNLMHSEKQVYQTELFETEKFIESTTKKRIISKERPISKINRKGKVTPSSEMELF